jgi:large subunit ribosomal protein L22
MGRSVLKFIRLSPTKTRLIAREIQGMNAEQALAALEFMPNKGAKVLYKVVVSALANSSLEAADAVITSARVDRGPVLRRWKPRARGRATKIRKPMSNIIVEVAQAEGGK